MSSTGEYLCQKQGPTENPFFENTCMNFIYFNRRRKKKESVIKKNDPSLAGKKNDPLKSRCTELHAALKKK